MKILFFIESLRAGGKERRIMELLKGLQQYPDVEIDLVLSRNEIHYKEVYDLGIPIHFAERRFGKKDPLVFFKFLRLVKQIKPDIIHVWGNMVAVYSLPAVYLLGIPLINNQITDATPNQKPLGKELTFKLSKRIIANTKAGLEAYHAPAAKSGVIYNGFNFSRLKGLLPVDEIRRRFSITTPHVVGMVATMSSYKDYPTYIRAAENILSIRRDVTFLCVGDGDATALKAMVKDSNTDRILFLGKQMEVESIMNVCDIGVLVTDIRNHAEGISNALLEFMALGKPVIATNFGGCIELIQNERSGFLIDAFNDAQLTERIAFLLDRDNERTRMGKNARERVEESFSIDKMVSSFYREYCNVLQPISTFTPYAFNSQNKFS